jgi:alkaline phosphatase
MQDQVGFIYTNSLSGVTDSAAGGTALATGKKVFNGNVAQLHEENLQQITTIAQNAGMKTGIVTTDGLNGATPAAFSAHAPDRDLNSEILRTQAQSGINLLLGQSSSAALTHYDYFTSAGYQFKLVRKDFQTTLDSYKGQNKFAGVLSEVGSQYIKGCESHYQLKDMAKYAVEFLENEEGFFLMVEGAYIDKYSEKNNLDSALSEVRSLIDTIEYLYEYAADGRTAIFITADHETGGLQKATSKASMSNSLYTTNVHTIKPVPLYVKNYSLDLTKFGYAAGATPENTVVFEACKSIING